jgi:hypothetical protein
MTAQTASDLAEAFREHRDAFGVSITFGTNPAITAIVAESEFGRELVGGGFAEVGDLQCKILLSDLPTAPANGDPVTYNGRAFKVTSVSIQPGSLIGEFNLRPAKR